MASVAIVFRKDKLNNKDEAPIHFRIIKDRRPKYISSGLTLNKKYWDEAKTKIKSTYQNSAYWNAFLTTKFGELQASVIESETNSKNITSRALKEKIMGKRAADFFPFCQNVISTYQDKGRIGTHDAAQSMLKKLKDYVGDRAIAFQDMDVTFLSNYEKHLRDKLGNNQNTIHGNMKFLRRMFNKAIKAGVIDVSVNPFLNYELKAAKAQKQFLIEDELKQIETLSLPKGTRIELHRDMFVFAAYVGGLRVSDVLLLKWTQFDGTHIHTGIKKTENQISIKLPNKALEIIRKYQPINKKVKHKYIFPMLPEDLKEDDLRAVDNAISGATAYINKNLKIIADKCEIEKPISFHISRHSFATLALTKGVSIDKVSKLMGHSKITQTQEYAKIIGAELDKAMDVFNT